MRGLGWKPEAVLDFSANTNPYGPSPLVREALALAAIECYPDRDALALRGALAESLSVSPAEILPGNGASELIWLIAMTYLGAGDRVLVLGPTYGEYARAAALMGASVTAWTAREENGFAPDVEEIEGLLTGCRPRLVFVCNPNNPTGTTLPPETIVRWAGRHPTTLFVVDEAYLPFASGLDSARTARQDNVLVVRSMTKDFGLAGLRLGYAVGPEDMIGWLKRTQPPWSVSTAAQAAGVAALRDRDHLRRCLSLLARATTDLSAGLRQLGLVPLPSATHFFLIRVGNGAAFRGALLRFGILVRDCASFGLPAYVRISARRPEDHGPLLRAAGATIAEVRLPDQQVQVPQARTGKPGPGGEQ
jgi:histidinol-phosphate aminotransferase